jgi:N-acetylglucosamine-6-phosphate deacetylase
MSSDLLIIKCRIAGAELDRQTNDILIKDGKISRIQPSIKPLSGIPILDAENNIAAPGFIDVHVHGADGADITDGTEKSLKTVCRALAKYGTTGFLATLCFKNSGDNRHIECAASLKGKDTGGARILGLHLEGPFISAQKKGMIMPDNICPPSPSTFNHICDLTAGTLSMMTIAPELPGGLRMINRIAGKDIIASFGHSSANYKETCEGIKAGISHVTHIFNAMHSMHHREPGPLPALMESERVTAQIIADGIHIHPSMAALAYRMLGPSRCVLITDGVQALGLSDGKYHRDGIDYEIAGGTARYKDGTLIGTAVGINSLISRFRDMTKCSFSSILRMVSENPARILGLDKKGSIEAGKDADIVIIDDNFNIASTIVEGKIVYDRKYS